MRGTYIITGASRGIGAATARLLSAHGVRVVLVARSRADLHALAATLPGEALVWCADVCQPATMRALVADVVGRYGAIDGIINNAGIGLAAYVATLDPADLATLLAVNVYGALHLTQAALPPMRRQGYGHIINISSVLAARSLPGVGGYAASKAALEGLSDALRVEVRGTGIAVTVVRPGRTATAFAQHRLGTLREQWRPPAVPPARVARAVWRAIQTRPRTAYVTPTDWGMLLAARLAPHLADAVLARLVAWDDPR